MTLFGKNKFAVVFCSPELFRGAVFARQNSRWVLVRSGEISSGPELPGVTATIKPAVDFETLDQVYVVTGFAEKQTEAVEP